MSPSDIEKNTSNPEGELSGVEQHTQAAREFLEAHPIESVPRYSAQEYFLWGLQNGLAARERGDYGIAACYVIRSGGIEIVSFGLNSLFSEKNPHGHAEMNSVKQVQQLLALPPEIRTQEMNILIEEGKMNVRRAPHNGDETLIYTTLEPCPMCTVGAAINSSVNEVIIAEPDDYAGALEDSRLANLAPLWKQIADEQGLTVTFSQNHAPESERDYLTPEHSDLLKNLFFLTKDDLDKHLKEHGFMNPYELIPFAAALLGENFGEED